MVIAYFLFETFKKDVCGEIIEIGNYANAVRRTIIDIASKIVHTANKVILKITETAMETLKFEKLWYLANNTYPIKI